MHFSVKHFFSLANWPASLTLSTVEVVPIYAFISPRLFILVSGFLTILADDDDVDAYLIFVTNPTNISVEKKFVMWRNFRFLCMTDV